MNWEKIRCENRCITHGTESIGEELALPGDNDQHVRNQHRRTITVGSPVAGMKLSSHPRENNGGKAAPPTTMAIFRVLSTVYKKEVLRTLSDADLKEGREICDSLNRSLREEQFERDRQNPYRR
jgi:hypothetical protein